MRRVRELWSQLQAWWDRMLPDREDQPRAESDVAADPAVARSRAHGGPESPPDATDATTTTGTSENDLFVGRVAGQDAGYAEETGAEARSSANPSRGA